VKFVKPDSPAVRPYLHLDQYSGKVLADVRFKDFGYLAQFSLWGIAAHEGQLFGLPNQILGTLAAGGVILIAISGLVMWWQRRPSGRFAANTPEGRPAARRLHRHARTCCVSAAVGWQLGAHLGCRQSCFLRVPSAKCDGRREAASSTLME